MPEINPELAQRRYGPEWMDLVALFRRLSLRVLEDRDAVLAHLDNPLIDRICGDRDSTCVERAGVYETLAYGDAGVLLSCPGPSLSGIVLRELGSRAQREVFFNHVAGRKTRTFMAVTEPEKGSDAGNMETRLDGDGRLHGEKWLVGNGRDGDMGTVIVRTGPGPFGIGVVMLTPEHLASPSVTRTLLPVTAMAGPGLSLLRFDGLKVGAEWVLGQEKRSLERGMLAVIKTFYRMRPCVAALALGTSQAALDAVAEGWGDRPAGAKALHTALQAQVDAARSLNLRASRIIDEGTMDGAAVSLAKAAATEAAERVAAALPDLVGVEAFATDPWMLKVFADCHGYEWMEGSTDIQRLNVGQGLA